MITQEHQIKVEELLASLTYKSNNDSKFKKLYISNPREVLSKEYGQEFIIPEGQELVVEDQTDSSIVFINIPRVPQNIDNFHLTDEQLECVAGGEVGGAVFWVVTAIAAGVTVGKALK